MALLARPNSNLPYRLNDPATPLFFSDTWHTEGQGNLFTSFTTGILFSPTVIRVNTAENCFASLSQGSIKETQKNLEVVAVPAVNNGYIRGQSS
jgi:hypothetical protein